MIVNHTYNQNSNLDFSDSHSKELVRVHSLESIPFVTVHSFTFSFYSYKDNNLPIE